VAEQARESRAADLIEIVPPARTAETVADIPGGATKALTEGIIKAEGLGWLQVVATLMAMIVPWKAKLTATFVLGVLRVVAFIGVGVLSALVVLALKHGTPYAPYLWALAVVAPLSGVLHWFESWLAHDMAFRLLAEMRIDAFRKLDALAPAYLVRRRTGDIEIVPHASDPAPSPLLGNIPASLTHRARIERPAACSCVPSTMRSISCSVNSGASSLVHGHFRHGPNCASMCRMPGSPPAR